MNARRVAAATLTAAAVLVPAVPASAACYDVFGIDTCDKPTDPYTDPVTGAVAGVFVDVVTNPAVEPTYWTVLNTGSYVIVTAYCTAGLC